MASKYVPMASKAALAAPKPCLAGPGSPSPKPPIWPVKQVRPDTFTSPKFRSASAPKSNVPPWPAPWRGRRCSSFAAAKRLYLLAMVECVANVSEGRNLVTLDRMSTAIRQIPGCLLLHRDVGHDAHRSVFTFAGSGEAVAQAALALADTCLRHIDMRQHQGSHPRIGALDVCPIVPLSPEADSEADATVAAIAAGLENRGVGGWLYAQSACHPGYADLAEVRRGEYEGLPDRRIPMDFGVYQPAFGATALGKRPFLLAYNIHVRGRNVERWCAPSPIVSGSAIRRGSAGSKPSVGIAQPGIAPKSVAMWST